MATNSTTAQMDKSQMIDAIIQEAKSAAILAKKTIDAGDLFFSLAFRTEAELKDLCKKLKIQ